MISTLMMFMAMLLVAMLVEPLSERLRIPFSALLVLVGFIGSEIIVALGFDTVSYTHLTLPTIYSV